MIVKSFCLGVFHVHEQANAAHHTRDFEIGTTMSIAKNPRYTEAGSGRKPSAPAFTLKVACRPVPTHAGRFQGP